MERVILKDSLMSYFILTNELEEDILIEKMLLNNKINGFLSAELRLEDNKKCFYYNINGLISIEEYIKDRMVDYKFLYNLYNTIIKTVMLGHAYFIQEDNYIIMPDYIYRSKKDNSISLCCTPWKERVFQDDILELTEILLKKTDHKDKKAVQLIYGLYDILKSDGFICESIDKYLNLNIQEFSAHDDKDCIDKSMPKVERNGKRKPINNAYGLAVCNNHKQDIIPSNNILPAKIWIEYSDNITAECEGKKNYIIGREKGSEIYIPFMYISRKHAMLFADDKGLNIVDMGSTNGTYVNNKKISANVTVHCNINDIVTFADINYRVIKKSEDIRQ